ncbi:MAG: ATP-binding protein [Kiritimatiellae bacterium]|nr:ATP-binding protein [Kiritimatiellia bacterium]
MKQNNPFVLVGYEGPKYFCDRVAETRSLIRAIDNGSNVTLLSPRRYGKTGLVSNVFHHLAKKGGYETIYLDLFGTQNLADFTNALANAVLGRLDTPLERAGGIAKRLIQSLRPTISYDTISGNPSLSFDVSANNPQNTLAQIFDYIKARERKAVIALDEFQQIGEYPEKGIEATLRGFVQFSPARFIFAGSKQHIMREMFTSPKRPFYQSTSMMPLDVIAEEAYYKFAEGFFSAKGRHIDREVFHVLYERFDGITWYLQAVLWEFYADDANIGDVGQLDTVISRRVKACEYDQQRVLTILPPGARRLLRAIAAEHKVKEPQSGSFVAKHGLRAASSVKTSLDMLVEKELVYPTSDGYVVYDRLMAEYLRSIAK